MYHIKFLTSLFFYFPVRFKIILTTENLNHLTICILSFENYFKSLGIVLGPIN